LRRLLGSFQGFTKLSAKRKSEEESHIAILLVFFGFAFIYLFSEALKTVLNNGLGSGKILGIPSSPEFRTILFIAVMVTFFGLHARSMCRIIMIYCKYEMDKANLLWRFFINVFGNVFIVLAANFLCLWFPFYFLNQQMANNNSTGRLEYTTSYLWADSFLVLVLAIILIWHKFFGINARLLKRVKVGNPKPSAAGNDLINIQNSLKRIEARLMENRTNDDE